MTSPSDCVWALVSGFAEPARQARGLLMLQVFTDDSGKLTDSPVCVLAGYLASAAQWAEFSNEWQEALNQHPRLDYFKASEAMAFNGQFLRFTVEQRDLRLELLVSIIKRYAQVGIVSVIPSEPFQRLVVGCTPAEFIDSPYFHLIHSLMGHFVRYAEKEGMSEPIDFIFDTQDDEPMVMEELRMGFNFFVEVAPPGVRPYFCDPPIFRSSVRTLPLQAADLLAWRARRAYFEIMGGSQVSEYPIYERLYGIPHLLEFWTEEKLRGVASDLRSTVIQNRKP